MRKVVLTILYVNHTEFRVRLRDNIPIQQAEELLHKFLTGDVLFAETLPPRQLQLFKDELALIDVSQPETFYYQKKDDSYTISFVTKESPLVSVLITFTYHHKQVRITHMMTLVS